MRVTQHRMRNFPSRRLGQIGLALLSIAAPLITLFLIVWKLPELYYQPWALAVDLRTGDLLKAQNDLRTILIQSSRWNSAINRRLFYLAKLENHERDR